MKKILFFTTLLFIAAGLAPLVAQQTASPSSSDAEGSYAITVSLERVYPYRKGYVVKYTRGLGKTADAYLPIGWFEGAGKKAELILLGSGTDWPHMTVFYRDGKFSHVRLYVRKERSHESWGNVPLNVNIDDRFEGVEEITLRF
ncbi:MAG: hypothetical protein LBU16_05700 [Treponema sp.]|nr:hypothetical protein [Treponema sp.]